jgi:hypothetical protein
MIRCASIGAVVLLLGCAGRAATPGPLPGGQGTIAPFSVHFTKAPSPAACGRGRRVRFRSAGGTFSVPSCAHWTSQIAYPGNGRVSQWRVIASIADDFGVPSPPTGTAIFYIQMTLKLPRSDGWRLGDGSGMTTVSNPQLNSGHSYTLMVYNFLEDSQCPSGDCPPWVANIGSPKSGEHSITFDSPLNGAIVDFADPVVWQFIQD